MRRYIWFLVSILIVGAGIAMGQEQKRDERRDDRAAQRPEAQRERHLQAMHQQRVARREARVATEDARADERVRVDVGVAQELVAIANDAARRTWAEAGERRAVGVHLVAEYPEVPGAQAATFPRLEA